MLTVGAVKSRTCASDAGRSGYRFGRFGWAGVALLSLQALAMMAWSTVLWQRFALTYDYSVYHQAWWLISHGQLSPFSTVLHLPFWQNNFELMMWPLALIGLVFPHGPTLLWVQDLCVVGAEMVAWRWLCRETARLAAGPRRLYAGLGLLLFLASPWTWWSISFDFHMESVAVLFAALAAYDLTAGRRRTWVWVALTLLCGDAEATWMAGLGLGALLAGQTYRRQGAALVAVGAGWVLLSTAVHGDSGGSVINLYGYLGGPSTATTATLSTLAVSMATHPGRLIGALWAHRVDLWANLAPGGVIGLASPWALGMAVPVLLANDLIRGNAFAQPIFQSLLLYVIVPLGTLLVLMRLHHRWPHLTLGLATLVAANALAWSAVWGPQIPTTWLRVPSATARVLARASALIPATAQVVASQGVAGRFSDRPLLYPLLGAAQQIPLQDHDTWWVIVPTAGIETAPSAEQVALVQELVGRFRARMVLHRHGVYVLHWQPPPSLRSVQLPARVTRLQAWLFPGTSGAPVLRGPESSWKLTSNGRRGYILSGDYWREPEGRYQASITLSSSGPVQVEVWNDSAGILLARRSLPPTGRRETVTFSVGDGHVYSPEPFHGWGPFQAAPTPIPGGNRVEIRVWTPGGATITIERIGLRRIGPLTGPP